MSRPPTADQRRLVAERAGERCEYCRAPAQFSPQSFECDHITPVSGGGATTLSNLAYACGGCNRRKGDRVTGIDPESGKEVSLFHPRSNTWHLHFTWSSDLERIIGLTAVGRATIRALDMNRPGVVNLRAVLVRANHHPPSDF